MARPSQAAREEPDVYDHGERRENRVGHSVRGDVKIFITGIRGFLGSSLEQALLAAGHQLMGSVSRYEPARPELRVMCIGEPVADDLFGDAEVVIHGAHDFSPGALERNVEAAVRLFEAAGTKRQMFISSCAASPDAAVEYGTAKFRIETFFLEHRQVIVRPGLVIGSGGLFGRQLRFMTSSPVIPLLDGGRTPIPVVGVADFCTAIVAIIAAGNHGGEFNLFNPDMPTTRQLTEAVLRASGHRAWLLPVSYELAQGFLRLTEALGIPLPVTTQNLGGARQVGTHRSTLEALVPRPATLDEMVRAACGQ
jgi:nucleoside-diphosphate-sugar epimerase